MKCPNCSHINPEGSQFCEECGHKLAHPEHRAEHPRHHSITDELSDILFVPKKKSHALRNTSIAISLFLIVCIWSVLWLASSYDSSSSSEDTTSEDTLSDTDEPLTTFPIEYLSIENGEMVWIGDTLYFKGTLKNTYSASAKDIRVRLDLYRDKAYQDLFDTRYVTIMGASDEGAYSFQEEVYASPETRFWSQFTIVSADFYDM